MGQTPVHLPDQWSARDRFRTAEAAPEWLSRGSRLQTANGGRTDRSSAEVVSQPLLLGPGQELLHGVDVILVGVGVGELALGYADLPEVRQSAKVHL
jgi:hypothetical protein